MQKVRKTHAMQARRFASDAPRYKGAKVGRYPSRPSSAKLAISGRQLRGRVTWSGGRYHGARLNDLFVLSPATARGPQEFASARGVNSQVAWLHRPSYSWIHFAMHNYSPAQR
jgi:hypothetical protein